MKTFFYFILFSFLFQACRSEQEIDLSGQWSYTLAPNNDANTTNYLAYNFTKSIQFPSLEAYPIIKNKTYSKLQANEFWTTKDTLYDISIEPIFTYSDSHQENKSEINDHEGNIWYQKKFELPTSWKEKHVTLTLERCLYETEAWLNSNYLGAQNSKATAHHYDLSNALQTENNTITIKVKKHTPSIAYTPALKIKKEDIRGEIALKAKPYIYINTIALLPNIKDKTVFANIKIKDGSNALNSHITLHLSAKNLQTGQQLPSMTREVDFQRQASINLTYPMGDKAQLWDEFSPNRYAMKVHITNEDGSDSKVENFGLIETKVIDNTLFINGKKSELKGTLDYALLPYTDYPPIHTKDWVTIFETLKAQGLNYVCFHSACPPAAAFDAADQIGIYLQLETYNPKNNTNLASIEQWLFNETENIIQNFSNHPSFVIMTHNYRSNDKYYNYLEKHINNWKTYNNRLLYMPHTIMLNINNVTLFIPSKENSHSWTKNNTHNENIKKPLYSTMK